jgi:hypothetical protein
MQLDWYYRRLGEDFGPVSLETLHELMELGQIDSDDLVRRSSEVRWSAASTLPRIIPATDSSFDLDQLMAAAAEVGDQSGTRARHGDESDHLTNERSTFAPSARTAAPVVLETWYCQSLGQVLGPYSYEHLKEMAANGSLCPNDDVRDGEDGTWLRAKRLPELFPKTEKSGLTSTEIDVVEQRKEWVCRIDGSESEPMTMSELKKLVKSGKLDRKDLVRRSWDRAGVFAMDVPGLTFPEPIAAPTPVEPTSRNAEFTPTPARSEEPATERPGRLTSSDVDALKSTAAAVPTRSYTPSAPSYTPPPSYSPPAYQAPIAPPPPPRMASPKASRSVSFSMPPAIMETLRNPKLYAGLGGGLLLVALFFLPGLLKGKPGVKEYTRIQQLWEEVDGAVKGNAPDATFKSLDAKNKAELATLRKQIEPKASAQNRLAQIILYCTRDHLPKIYNAGPEARKKKLEAMRADLQEANELYQRMNG